MMQNSKVLDINGINNWNMIDTILNFTKKLVPERIFLALQPIYHFTMGYLAAVRYRWPSNNMIVIGITGTTGKTTSIFLMTSILKATGMKVGYISTAMFSDGEKEIVNDKKMTMPGRFFVQKILQKMAGNGCDVAIVETTSEGIVQFRHRFINYDILVFTGLYPEHIESHGSFEKYKEAKGKLFAHLKNCKVKRIKGEKIKKTIVANSGGEHSDYFLQFWAERKIAYQLNKEESATISDNEVEKIIVTGISADEKSIAFTVNNNEVRLNLIGKFNVENALASIGVGLAFDIPLSQIKEGLEKVNGVPGRLEKIDEGQKFAVIVDYAFEPNAISKLYETVKLIPHNKIIHVLGSTGGGRDKARRPKLGKLAADIADYVIITNEDPYDEDPKQIIDEVAFGIKNKKENSGYWKMSDRREGIKKALTLARERDIVLVTGKGNEQAICVANGKKIPWDDRKIIRELLQELWSG